MKSAFFPLIFLLLPVAVHGQMLYGVTAKDLVTINYTTGVTTKVASLGLPANVVPQAIAWNTTLGTIYGLTYEYSGSTVTDQKIIQINPATGASSTVWDLGSSVPYTALEYFSPYNTKMHYVREPNGPNSADLAFFWPNGVSPVVSQTPYGISSLAYVDNGQVIVEFDPSGGGKLHGLGVNAIPFNLGAAPSPTTGDMAYSFNRLYALDSAPGNHSLYRVALGNGVTTLESTVTLDGDQVRGIAFANVPEPSEWTACAGIGLGVWALGRRLRR
jgi:hypothetical protein